VLWAGRPEVPFQAGKEIYSSPNGSDRLWSPWSSLPEGKAAGFRMSTAVPPLPYIPSQHEQR